jgi:hypothetical protein
MEIFGSCDCLDRIYEAELVTRVRIRRVNN